MIALEQAWQILDDALTPLDSETRPLDTVLGAVLAQPVASDRDYPPTDRSAMDGFAVRSTDAGGGAAVSLRVVGELAAGSDPSSVVVGPGQACRIFTGACVPQGADAVVMVEDTDEDRQAQTVLLRCVVRKGQHIRVRGEDRRGGESVLLQGTVLGPADLAALATVGCDPVRVVSRPTTAILSTGDEIVPVTSQPQASQIRNSNAAMLQAQVTRAGFAAETIGIVGDDTVRLRAAIAEGLRRDVFLLTGGVSVGEYDLVAAALQACGVETLFHGVRMKPGKPIFVGRRVVDGRAQTILALPGNPLSAFVGFQLFGLPALRRLAGHPGFAPVPSYHPLASSLSARAGRTTFHLARRWQQDDGQIVVEPVPSRGSGDVLALTRAGGFIRTGEEGAKLDAGTPVPFYGW